MLKNFTRIFTHKQLYNQPKYFLLDHHKMEKEKEVLFKDK